MTTFPHIADGEPMSVSATLFVTFGTCPQQALGRVQGIYPPDTIASFKGSLAHRLFARHLLRGPIPEEDIDRACREEIGATEGHLNKKLAPLGLNRPSALAPVLAEVTEIYQRFKRLPIDDFRNAEVPLIVPVAGKVTLRGRLDAIFGDPVAPIIVDWKTGSWLENSDAQLRFYVLLWFLVHGTLPVRAEAISVATGERAAVDPSVAEIDATAGEIASMVRQLRGACASGIDLERRAGPHCRWCPLLPDCADGQSAISVLDGR